MINNSYYRQTSPTDSTCIYNSKIRKTFSQTARLSPQPADIEMKNAPPFRKEKNKENKKKEEKGPTRQKQQNPQTKKQQQQQKNHPTITCGIRTCDSGLQSYTCVTDA